MLEMTPEEAQAVQFVWESWGNGKRPIPDDIASQILAMVRVRFAEIKEQRRVAIVFLILVIVVIGAIGIKELLR